MEVALNAKGYTMVCLALDLSLTIDLALPFHNGLPCPWPSTEPFAARWCLALGLSLDLFAASHWPLYCPFHCRSTASVCVFHGVSVPVL